MQSLVVIVCIIFYAFIGFLQFLMQDSFFSVADALDYCLA